MTRRSVVSIVLALAVAAIGDVSAMTLTAGDANIVQLLQQSKDIIVGTVTKVEDGIDERGVPYTEITLQVSESIRGVLPPTYKFRQFGLLKPRPAADGQRTLMPAPEGFPQYAAGEEVVLMLRPAAKLTGFRMPAGVKGGKFRLTPGRAENAEGNAGLFRNVRLERGLATADESRMMAGEGAVSPDTFLPFLRRAVQEQWIETGKLGLVP